MGCAIDGCDRKLHARGWCELHYRRNLHTGDPLGVKPNPRNSKPTTPYERVMARLVPLGDCLIFAGARNPAGYGHLGYHGRMLYAHRVVIEHHLGPSPLIAMHSCDNPSCCNIEHLRYGTQRDNIRDAMSKGRHFTPFVPGHTLSRR
jgi:hypothetical protein